jgi:hypothetical protein
MASPIEYFKLVIRKLRSLVSPVDLPAAPSGNSPPEDPYSYVTAPRKPRRPTLSAAAVAELPNE